MTDHCTCVCGNDVDLDKSKEAVRCPCCLKAAYCGETCRTKDWAVHKCQNAIAFPLSAGSLMDSYVGFAVPYFYEDLMTESQVAELDDTDPVFQTYTLTQQAPDRTVTSATIDPLLLIRGTAMSKDNTAPLARGHDPTGPDPLPAGHFYLQVTMGTVVYQGIVGDIPHDMVYAGNKTNDRVRKMAGGGDSFKERMKNKLSAGRRGIKHLDTSYIFLAPTNSVRDQRITATLGDVEYKVELFVSKAGDSKTRYVDVLAGATRLPRNDGKLLSDVSTSLKRHFHGYLQTMFEGTGLSVKNLYAVRHGDANGAGVVLVFSIPPRSNKADLVGVEFIAGVENVRAVFAQDDPLHKTLRELEVTSAPIKTQARFHCDARSLDQVEGLLMAVADVMTPLPPDRWTADTATRMQNAIADIKCYAQELADQAGMAPQNLPPKLLGDIAFVTETIYAAHN